MDWPLSQVVVPSGAGSPQEAGHRLVASVSLPDGTAIRATGAGLLLLATTEPLLDAAAACVLRIDPESRLRKPQLNYIPGEPILEPYATIELRVPAKAAERVIGDLESRRGSILYQSSEVNDEFIRAELPMAELFGYSTTLRSIVQSPCPFEQAFSGYKPVPGSNAQNA